MKSETKEYIKLQAYDLLLGMYDNLNAESVLDDYKTNWLDEVDNLMWYRESHDTEHPVKHNPN